MSNIIFLQIEGAECEARVSEISHRHHNMYNVSFKTGYENIFYTDVETGKWIEEDLGFTDLAHETGIQIRAFMRNPFHVPKLLTWHKEYINEKLICFGFFNFMNGDQKFYQIYNDNKKYMYTLVHIENDEWQILGNSQIQKKRVDISFVRHVIEILPLYTTHSS